MNEFDPELFYDSIDTMCEDAIRRMHAIQEGGINNVMQPGDEYFSTVRRRDHLLGLIEYETLLSTEIIGDIHIDMTHGDTPDYFLGILALGAVVLSRHAKSFGKSSTHVWLTQESAVSHIEEIFIRHQNFKSIELFSQELGSFGLTSLVINSGENSSWSLDYEARRNVSMLGAD